MMKLVEEIKKYFAALSIEQDGYFVKIQNLPDAYPAIALTESRSYVVAVKCKEETEFSEYFSNCHLYTKKMSNVTGNGETENYLLLACSDIQVRNEFASLCTFFLDPGVNGEMRTSLLNDPYGWWDRWCELLGNSISRRSVSSIIAELYILKELFKVDKSVKWTGADASSHDIEAENYSYEVKSSTSKYKAEIHVTGQFQLKNGKPLYLTFLKMEESGQGESINSLVNELIDLGYDRVSLETKLYRQGIEKASSMRKETYSINEVRKYVVDDKFPKIIDKSFKNDQIPFGITRIEYTIDLDAVPYNVL